MYIVPSLPLELNNIIESYLTVEDVRVDDLQMISVSQIARIKTFQSVSRLIKNDIKIWSEVAEELGLKYIELHSAKEAKNFVFNAINTILLDLLSSNKTEILFSREEDPTSDFINIELFISQNKDKLGSSYKKAFQLVREIKLYEFAINVLIRNNVWPYEVVLECLQRPAVRNEITEGLNRFFNGDRILLEGILAFNFSEQEIEVLHHMFFQAGYVFDEGAALSRYDLLHSKNDKTTASIIKKLIKRGIIIPHIQMLEHAVKKDYQKTARILMKEGDLRPDLKIFKLVNLNNGMKDLIYIYLKKEDSVFVDQTSKVCVIL